MLTNSLTPMNMLISMSMVTYSLILMSMHKHLPNHIHVLLLTLILQQAHTGQCCIKESIKMVSVYRQYVDWVHPLAQKLASTKLKFLHIKLFKIYPKHIPNKELACFAYDVKLPPTFASHR